MKVATVKEAWEAAARMFPTDYRKDEESSKRAGYPIYRSTAEDHYNSYICDLNDRLEVNMNGKSTNIWIQPDSEPKEKTYIRVVYYREKDGNSQHELQLLAADILKYGKIVDECYHVSQQFFPDGTKRVIETGTYCMEALNEITGNRYWVHFSGCKVTEIIENRIMRQ